jgi:hypothetical protein
MYPALTCALVALAAAAQAALPTSGLPSGDHAIAAHISAETFYASKIGKALELAADKDAKEEPNIRKLRESLGIDLEKDIRDATIVGKITSGNPDISGLIRGRFNKDKIEGFASSRKVPHKTVAGLKAWKADSLIEAVLGESAEAAEEDGPVLYVVIVDGSTLVLASDTMLASAVAAAKDNKPWKHAGLTEAAATTSNAWVMVAADVQAIEKLSAADDPDAKPSGAKTASLGLGEDAKNLLVRLNATFVDAAKAKDAIAQFQGLVGFAQLGLMANPDDSPEDAANKVIGRQLLQSLKSSVDGTKASISIDYPIEKAVIAMLKALAEANSQAEAAPKGK